MASPDRKRDFKPTIDRPETASTSGDHPMQLKTTKGEVTMTKRRRMGGTTIGQAFQVLGDPNSSPYQVLTVLSDFKAFTIEEVVKTKGAISVLVRLLDSSVVVFDQEIPTYILRILANAAREKNNLFEWCCQMGIPIVQYVAPFLGHGHHFTVKNEASVVLANIAVGSMNCREKIFEQDHLVEELILNMGSPYTLERTVALVAILCENASFDLTHPMVEPLGKALLENFTSISDGAKSNILRALSLLSKGTEKQIQTVMNTQTTAVISCLLKHDNRSILRASLSCLVNFTKGNEAQTQEVIEALKKFHGVASIGKIIDMGERETTSSAIQLLNNLSNGSPQQIAILLEPALLGPLVKTAQFTVMKRFRDPALEVLANICCNGAETQVLEVVNKRGLRPLIDALRLSKCTDLIIGLLDAIRRIWKVCAMHNKIPKLIDEFENYHGKEKLEKLTRIPGEVEAKASLLIDLYEHQMEVLDQGDEETLDENVAPVKLFDYGVNPANRNNHFGQHDDRRSFGNPNRGPFYR